MGFALETMTGDPAVVNAGSVSDVASLDAAREARAKTSTPSVDPSTSGDSETTPAAPPTAEPETKKKKAEKKPTVEVTFAASLVRGRGGLWSAQVSNGTSGSVIQPRHASGAGACLGRGSRRCSLAQLPSTVCQGYPARSVVCTTSAPSAPRRSASSNLYG